MAVFVVASTAVRTHRLVVAADTSVLTTATCCRGAPSVLTIRLTAVAVSPVAAKKQTIIKMKKN